MKEFWNDRYSKEEYAYGQEPNEFFKSQIQNIRPGKIFLPCEGEGRNAVYAAKLGWKVTALDWSEAAKEKAEKLATINNVNIEYHICDILDFTVEKRKFNAIGLIFAHFPSQIRMKIHSKLITILEPEGKIILEGFSKNHVSYQKINPQIGGPQNPDLLYSIEELEKDFYGLKFEILQEKEVYLNEGLFHIGWGSVVRMVGKIV